jgi:glycogen(starch) synthase
MLSWEYPPRIVGGISPHVYELSHELVKKGVEVHVITKETPLAPDEEIDPGGVNVHRVHLSEQPNDFVHEIQLLNQATDLRARELLEVWREEGKPTLFHAHDWLGLDSARELKYEYKLPVVATIHATEEGRNNGIHNEMQRYIHDQEYWLSYEAWRVIVCSEYMKEQVHASFDCPTDKIDVIYNGVNTAKFEFEWPAKEKEAYRAQFATPEEKIAMYVGRFVREKGIHVLLNAAGTILARHQNTKFVVVGGGNRDKFERFVDWYGLRESVLFTGFMANQALWKLYRVTDVAVFPSLYEPFGIVALEGMAAGAAVVSSDAGGLREVVKHDETGTLSFADSPESLAWAILRVLENPDRAERLKEAASVRLKVDFDWANLAGQTIAVYRRVWEEFTRSFWFEETLWPQSPGAKERAERLKVKEKARTGALSERPRPAVSVPEKPKTLDHEDYERS